MEDGAIKLPHFLKALQPRTTRTTPERIIRNTSPEYDLVPREYRIASASPLFQEKLRELSIEEDLQNSYYTGILNIISESCVGTVPHILGQSPNNTINDLIEDAWVEWCTMHHIGAALRECRREAAKTGLGILIPYIKQNTGYPVRLALKNISVTQLRSPVFIDDERNIVDGIEYDEAGDIIAIYVESGDPIDDEPIRYSVPQQALVWKKPIMQLVPECGPAFCLFPSVRRFMKAVVRGEELRQSIPMAVELDKDVYRPDETDEVPTGAYEYEPGMVPTLPPGTKLTGLNISPQNEERASFIKLVISAAARCKNMPMNIALGDSSNHNMASAQVDIEPWKNTVDIDRHDFEPLVRQVFSLWFYNAQLVEDYLPAAARSANFTYSLNYKRLFSHPDPNKRANANMTNLVAGSTTLARLYLEDGLNARREHIRDAQLLGITYEEYQKKLIAGQSPAALQVLKLLPEVKDEPETSKK